MQVIYPQAAINNSYFSLPAGTSSSDYIFNKDPSSPSPTMQPNLNDSVQIQQLLALLNNNMLPKQTAVVECPKSMVGRVIGKGGETIKALQQYTGAMIQIDQSTDPTRVTIAGSPQALQLAVSMVSDIVRGTFKGFAMLRQIAIQHGNGPSSSSNNHHHNNNNNNNNVATAPLPPTFTPSMQQQQQSMPAIPPSPQTMQQQMYHQQPTPILLPPPPVVHTAVPPPLTPAGTPPTTSTAGTSHPVYIQGYGFIPPSQSTFGGEGGGGGGGGGFDDVAAAMMQQQQPQQQRHVSPMNPFRAAPPPGNNSSNNTAGGGVTAQSLAALLGTLGAPSQQNNNHNHVQQQPGSDMNEALLTALLSQLTVGQQRHPQGQGQGQPAAYQQQYAPPQQQYQHQQQDAPRLFHDHGGNEHTYSFPPPSSFLSSSPPSHPASSASPPSNSGHASPSMFPSAAHPHQQMGLSSSGDLPLLSSPTRQPTTSAAGGGGRGGSRYGAIGSARSPTGGSSLKGEHQDSSIIADNSNDKVLAEPQQINMVTTAATEVTDEEEDGNASKKELLVPTTWAEAVSNGSTTAVAGPQGLATSPSSSN